MTRYSKRKKSLHGISKKIIGLRQSWKTLQETRRRALKRWPRIGLRKRLFVVVAFVVATTSAVDAQVSFGHATPFLNDWRFANQPFDDSAAIKADFDDSRWRQLTLPHDWSVEHPMSPQLFSCTGYLPGGVGWYRRHFTLDELTEKGTKPRQDSQWFIYFEGIYNRAEVYLNGHLLGMRPNGYASVLYDMTPYLNKEGDNVLAVRVDHSRQADSRWYTGSGIYRPVWIVESGPVHLAQWGSAWRLKSMNHNTATVEVDIETATAQGYAANAPRMKAEVIIKDAQGRQVAKGQTAIGAQEKRTLVMKINRPTPWDIGNGYLYSVETETSRASRNQSS